jgi:hypothetical protein
LQKFFAAGETAKTVLATGVAGCSDRGDQKDYVRVRKDYQRGVAEQKKGRSNNNNNNNNNNNSSNNNSSREMERMSNSKNLFGIQEDFQS